MSENFTDSGLPVVQQQTVDAIFDRYADRGLDFGQFLERSRESLTKDNPSLVKYAEGLVGQHPAEMHDALFQVAVGVYAMLDHQAGLYKLNDTIGEL